MKELSAAEYATAMAILGAPLASDRTRILESGLPSSTYNVDRRRIYEEGWLSDRLLLQPGPAGLAGVSFALVKPPSSEREAWVQRWAADRRCSFLWSGVHLVLGVFFDPTSPPTGEEVPSGPPGTRPFALSVDRSKGEVPVYFDYAGAWARFGGRPVPRAYPQGLDLQGAPADSRLRRIAAEVLRAPGSESEEGPTWFNLLRLPRSQRRVVQAGLVVPRTVVDLVHLPGHQGRRIGEVILITGTLRGGTPVRDLLGRLTSECAVFPFLLAGRGERFLLGGLGQTSAKAPGRVPVPAARKSVSSLLAALTVVSDVAVEPVESLVTVVDHRSVAPT